MPARIVRDPLAVIQSAGSPTPSPPMTGVCRYRADSGWTYDSDLLRLWGVQEADADRVLLDPVLPAATPSGAMTWESLVAALAPGSVIVGYRLLRAGTADVRDIQAVLSFSRDAGIDCVQARHLDVTPSVAAARLQERARARATTDRLLVVGQLGAAAAAGTHPADLLHRIARLTAAGIGGAAHLVVLRADDSGSEWDIVAPQPGVAPQPAAGPGIGVAPQPGVAPRPEAGPGTGIAPGPAVHPPGDGSAAGPPLPDGHPARRSDRATTVRAADLTAVPRTCRHTPGGHSEIARALDLPADPAHYLTALLQIDGRPTGLLAVLRDETTDCFDPADQGLLQVLADGAGAAVAQARACELLHTRAQQLHRLAGEREDLREQRDDLLEQLDSAETRERALVAEVVHDDPLQLIVAASLRLDLVPPHPDRSAQIEIDHAIGLLEDAGERLRDLTAVGLTPPDLQNGLWPAVRTIAEVLFAGSQTTVSLGGPPDPLSDAATSTAYRVVREAIMNARKHARAHALTVVAARNADSLVVTVRDDGVGCDRQTSPEGHFGISIMKTRAEAAGGSVVMGRHPGGGCEVRLQLPNAFLE